MRLQFLSLLYRLAGATLLVVPPLITFLMQGLAFSPYGPTLWFLPTLFIGLATIYLWRVGLSLLLKGKRLSASAVVVDPKPPFILPLWPWHNVLVLVSAGFITGLSGVVTFRRAKTTVNPTKPHASSLVTSGVYAISRNPMYLGGLTMLLGWAIFLSNPLAFLFLPVYVLYLNRLQIAPEERVLTSLFGETYVTYQARARRWL